jgi:hypothetical protein
LHQLEIPALGDGFPRNLPGASAAPPLCLQRPFLGDSTTKNAGRTSRAETPQSQFPSAHSRWRGSRDDQTGPCCPRHCGSCAEPPERCARRRYRRRGFGAVDDRCGVASQTMKTFVIALNSCAGNWPPGRSRPGSYRRADLERLAATSSCIHLSFPSARSRRGFGSCSRRLRSRTSSPGMEGLSPSTEEGRIVRLG